MVGVGVDGIGDDGDVCETLPKAEVFVGEDNELVQTANLALKVVLPFVCDIAVDEAGQPTLFKDTIGLFVEVYLTHLVTAVGNVVDEVDLTPHYGDSNIGTHLHQVIGQHATVLLLLLAIGYQTAVQRQLIKVVEVEVEVHVFYPWIQLVVPGS